MYKTDAQASKNSQPVWVELEVHGVKFKITAAHEHYLRGKGTTKVSLVIDAPKELVKINKTREPAFKRFNEI